MLLIVAIILAIVSFSVIIFIIARHYYELVLLDVDSIPDVREGRKKEVFMRKKAEKKNVYVYSRVRGLLKPLFSLIKNIQNKFRRFVASIERKAHMHEVEVHRAVTPQEKVKQELTIKQLMIEAGRDMEQGDYDTAEKRYLAVLRQSPKHVEAYKGLARVYYKQEQYVEAKETYQFVLQLDPHDEDTYVKLGDMYEEDGRLEKAVEHYQQVVIINPHNPVRFAKLYELLFELKQYDIALEAIEQALEIEPQNPKYLDNFIEVSILLERSDLAEQGYRELRMINPENQKLDLFRQRIDEIEKK